VTAAEVGQRGFGSDGRMLIRFENHIFLEKWGRQDPGRYWEHFYFDPERPWSDHRWRATVDARWQPCHGRQADEWAAFELARTLDETAAKESTAMGAPRLMGFLHPEIGHQSVDQMYSDFAAGEGAQLVGFFDFLRGPSGHSRRLAALRQHDFCKFAALHNGPGQAAAYGAMIAHAFEAFQGLNPLG
jgi:hypothetical protein